MSREDFLKSIDARGIEHVEFFNGVTIVHTGKERHFSRIITGGKFRIPRYKILLCRRFRNV